MLIIFLLLLLNLYVST